MTNFYSNRRLIFYLLLHKVCSNKTLNFDFAAVSSAICSEIFVETQFIATQFDEVAELKDLFMEQSNFS